MLYQDTETVSTMQRSGIISRKHADLIHFFSYSMRKSVSLSSSFLKSAAISAKNQAPEKLISKTVMNKKLSNKKLSGFVPDSVFFYLFTVNIEPTKSLAVLLLT